MLSLSAPDPVEHPLLTHCRMCGGEGLRWAGTSGAYALYECDDCGFVFAPAVRRAQAAYRGGGPPGRVGRRPPLPRPRLRAARGRASREGRRERSPPRAPLRVRPQHFGCAHSRVPHLLRERGHRVVGVDLLPPDPSLRPPHEDRLTGDLLRMRLDGGQFDLAYAFQVFEHLPEPRPVLYELLRLVRPGGLVLVHTDMETEERLAAERNGGLVPRRYVMPPAHCSYYRPRTFERALEGRGAHVEWSDPKRVLVRVLSQA